MSVIIKDGTTIKYIVKPLTNMQTAVCCIMYKFCLHQFMELASEICSVLLRLGQEL